MQTASQKIIQSADQPREDLHTNLQKPLRQLGHRFSTVPASEQPVLAGGFEPPFDVEDIAHAGKEALEEVVTGQTSRVRITKSADWRSKIWQRAADKINLWKSHKQQA